MGILSLAPRSVRRYPLSGKRAWFRARCLSAPPLNGMLASHKPTAAANRLTPMFYQPTAAPVLHTTEGRSNRPRRGMSAGAARAGKVWPPSASPPGLRRLRAAAAGCGNDWRDPCASRRPVRARLLPQTPERARNPWRVPPCEDAPAANRARGRRGTVLTARAVLKLAEEFADAPLCMPGCSRCLGGWALGVGLGLAARGTSGSAVGRACGGGLALQSGGIARKAGVLNGTGSWLGPHVRR